MKLSELPLEIQRQSLIIQDISREITELLSSKKEMDIEIERKVQSLDPKVFKNENQREIARFDLRSDGYKTLLADIVNAEADLAEAKIQLQYLRDMFAVEKIENQGAIAAAYV